MLDPATIEHLRFMERSLRDRTGRLPRSASSQTHTGLVISVEEARAFLALWDALNGVTVDLAMERELGSQCVATGEIEE